VTHAAFGSRARGSLSQVTAAGIIREVHAGRKSGVLHLTRAGVSKRLYFKAGSIILAGSDLPEDRLGQALLRAGMIQETDLERALGVVETTGRAIGETIVEMGLLRPEQIQIEAARRTKLIVESVLDWDSGEYAFEEREERLDGEFLSEISVPETLLEGIRGARSGDVVRRLLGKGKTVFHRPEHPPATLAAIRLTPPEEWVLGQANGVSSADEIAARCPMGAEAASRALCGLFLAGAFEAGPAQAPAAVTGAPGGVGADAGAGTQLWVALEADRADAGGFLGRTAPLSPRLPDTLGRYVVEEAIGRGSMGAVLLARDPAIDRPVAVKLIQTSVLLTPPEWEKYKERFYREARAAGKLLHPGIVTIFDVGHGVEGVPFIVMEYVEGRTLAELAQETALSLEEVLRIAGECLEALEYAHAQGVVHRDLKPANILITAAGRPKIMDFGVAHVVGSQMTHADEILGSPQFMAPEQLGKRKVDQRTDLFSFGVVLYWMLTGRLPFTGDSFAAIAQAILSERPAGPQQLKKTVPRALGTIVLRCLEKDPAKRFATAAELRAALRKVATRLPQGTSRAKAIAGLALLLLAALGSFFYLRRAPGTVPDAPPPPPTASTPTPQGAEELRWRKALPLTFTARHSHRIGGCSGSLLLDAWGVEFRSSEHPRWRFKFGEIRVLEREDPRKLHIEADEKDAPAPGKLKSYNFALVGRPLGDQDWARYRKLANK
jgi:predicted Ser/Thr protein kinase